MCPPGQTHGWPANIAAPSTSELSALLCITDHEETIGPTQPSSDISKTIREDLGLRKLDYNLVATA